ncbi:MAG: transposase [Methylobacteriaceae bacterium]|nr:transposase [Rhodoblastus sp.]MCC0004410.1 transposase [Methylobacteriaceae bacterium]
MLSAIILAPPDADPMAGRAQDAIIRSLAALVGAAVADVVRDACIAGAPDAQLAAIADHAGCALVEDADARTRVEKALHVARGDRVFLLAAGYAPMSGFIDEMSDWSLSASPPAVVLRAEPDSLARRIFPALAPSVGVIALKRDVLAVAGDNPAALARKLGARTLHTRARRVV